MKIGDRVRFLYDKGGGIIRGFKNKDIIIVEDETGFEIPILKKECLLLSTENDIQVSKKSQAKDKDDNQITASKVFEQPDSSYKYEETKEGEQISLHLMFLSNDLKTLGTSTYDIYLINESNYFLNYTLLNQEGNYWLLRKNGLIEPNTKIFLEEIEPNQANALEHICLQAIAYKKDKPFMLKSAISKDLRIDLSKLFKVHCFKENKFFEEPGITYSLFVNDAELDIEINIKNLKKAFTEKSILESLDKKSEKPKVSKKNIKRNKPEIIEIDLHINELLDNTKGMTNTQMLEYQLDIFNKIMLENLQNKGQKIIFIHGKGEGVLRKAILDELKKKYKKTEVQDASFREYGYGATMVIVH